jgi:ribulose-phosphate 3-epimerase
MERVENLSDRIQVDLMDGEFAPTKSPDIDKIWFPEGKQIDLHLMYQHPADVLNDVLELNPSMLIVHKEAEVDFATLAGALHASDIKFGLAILPETQVADCLEELEYVDHVLIFSGDLGHFNGKTDFNLLKKIDQLRKYKPGLEIGWDGGINAENAKQLAVGGVDVLNVGGFIQTSDDPAAAYSQLTNLLQS